jgi:hypothetical protein
MYMVNVVCSYKSDECVYKGCTIIFKLMFHRCLDLPDFFCFHNVLLIASFVRVIKVRFEDNYKLILI